METKMENIEIKEKKKSNAGRPKGGGGPNKSGEIRKYLEKNPHASTQDIIDALKENNIDVSQALIAGVKSKGDLTDGIWIWATKSKSKSKKKIEVTDIEIMSLQKLIDKFDSEEEMDTINIIDYFSDVIENIGSYEKFKIAYNAIKMNISSEDESDESDESDDDDTSTESDEDDDTSTSTECETVTMSISDYEDDDDDDDD